MSKIHPGQVYRHFKGKYYRVVCLATHSETEEEMVVYQAMYGREKKIYVRPVSMFTSEVDHDKYPKVKQKYRFELTIHRSAPQILQ